MFRYCWGALPRSKGCFVRVYKMASWPLYPRLDSPTFILTCSMEVGHLGYTREDGVSSSCCNISRLCFSRASLVPRVSLGDNVAHALGWPRWRFVTWLTLEGFLRYILGGLNLGGLCLARRGGLCPCPRCTWCIKMRVVGSTLCHSKPNWKFATWLNQSETCTTLEVLVASWFN